MPRIKIEYGTAQLTVDLPLPCDVRGMSDTAPLPSPAEAIRRSYTQPIDTPSLAEIARSKLKRNPKSTAVVVVSDNTRPVPYRGAEGILVPLLETLLSAGYAPQRITILIGTGSHRPMKESEIEAMLGLREAGFDLPVANHDYQKQEDLVYVGKTGRGSPVWVNKLYSEADLKIVTGLVEPHFMAGYSGGRKLVAPGVAYQDTILNFHTAHILEHEKSANCVIEGNPLHEEQIEIVRKIGGIVALNVVIDEKRRIGFVNFGEVEASHREAVAFMRKHAEVTLPRRFRTIVTTSAGYPLDRTYYQTVKGMVGVVDILEPGGTIIIASECSEGMGSGEFVAAQRLLCEVGPDRFMSVLTGRDKAHIDEWQTEMLVKALRVGTIRLHTTGLGKEDLKDVFVEPVSSIEEAVVASVKEQGDPDVAVVPEGPYVIPRCH